MQQENPEETPGPAAKQEEVVPKKEEKEKQKKGAKGKGKGKARKKGEIDVNSLEVFAKSLEDNGEEDEGNDEEGEDNEDEDEYQPDEENVNENDGEVDVIENNNQNLPYQQQEDGEEAEEADDEENESGEEADGSEDDEKEISIEKKRKRKREFNEKKKKTIKATKIDDEDDETIEDKMKRQKKEEIVAKKTEFPITDKDIEALTNAATGQTPEIDVQTLSVSATMVRRILITTYGKKGDKVKKSTPQTRSLVKTSAAKAETPYRVFGSFDPPLKDKQHSIASKQIDATLYRAQNMLRDSGTLIAGAMVNALDGKKQDQRFHLLLFPRSAVH